MVPSVPGVIRDVSGTSFRGVARENFTMRDPVACHGHGPLRHQLDGLQPVGLAPGVGQPLPRPGREALVLWARWRWLACLRGSVLSVHGLFHGPHLWDAGGEQRSERQHLRRQRRLEVQIAVLRETC